MSENIFHGVITSYQAFILLLLLQEYEYVYCYCLSRLPYMVDRGGVYFRCGIGDLFS